MIANRTNYGTQELIIARHDHQADFSNIQSREFASLWNAPVTVTTAVQFFETLGNNHPSRLRKLHELPGSAIFIDESHAAMPTWLWPQMWIWLKKLASDWNCHIVLASGTLAKFWTLEGFSETKEDMPDLIPEKLRQKTSGYETERIVPKHHPGELNLGGLISLIKSKEGPRLIIVNTVYSAAYIAREMKSEGCDVLHLSTALTPNDRDEIIKKVEFRLNPGSKYTNDWTLVATSCIEAGVDLSFRVAFREDCSMSSLLQTGGRVNREGKMKLAELWSVSIVDEKIKNYHPAFINSSKILRELFEEGFLEKSNITDLITEAMRRELKADYDEKTESLKKLEKQFDFPEVAKLCRIIKTDTRMVLVNKGLARQIKSGVKTQWIEIVRNSVQLWGNKIRNLEIPAIYEDELYEWIYEYDSEFLGFMSGVLNMEIGEHNQYGVL